MEDLQRIYAQKGYNLDHVNEILDIYRAYQKRVNDALTVHHIISIAEGGSDHDRNRLRLRRKKHTALHDMFDNRVTPEKIRYILDQDKTVLDRHFVRSVDDTIAHLEKRGCVYANGVWR